MAELSDTVKHFIVQRLACYDTPSQVSEAVHREHGLAVSRQQVQKYDVARAGKKPAQRWCTLFHATRERFIVEVEQVPIAQRAVRLRRLDRMCAQAESRGNLPLAASLLEQAAKDVGGFYTNRRELTGKDGGPIATLSPFDALSNAELVAAVRDLAAEFEGDPDEAIAFVYPTNEGAAGR